MKIYLCVIIICFAVSISCQHKPKHRRTITISGVHDPELAKKVSEWLDDQKSNGSTNAQRHKDANIDLLKQSLDFASVTLNPLDEQHNLIALPVSDYFKRKKSLDLNSIATMFMFIDSSGVIRDGGVIYYTSKGERKHDKFDAASIKNLLQGQKEMDDGIYRFLSLKGRWFSQMEIKNGKHYSTANIETQYGPIGIRYQGLKTDWYLVTHYSYGSGRTDTTRQYLGTTTKDCDDAGYPSLCLNGELPMQ